MIRYTKYGKHRYQIFIYDENGEVEEHITENVGNRNVMYKFRGIGRKFFPNYYVYNSYDNNHEREVLNFCGYYIIGNDGKNATTITILLNNIKIIIIDMMQLDKVPDIVLEKTDVKFLNREKILEDILNN